MSQDSTFLDSGLPMPKKYNEDRRHHIASKFIKVTS